MDALEIGIKSSDGAKMRVSRMTFAATILQKAVVTRVVK